MSARDSDPSAHPSDSREERAIAVALRDESANGRPRIVASGYGEVAQRILEIAFASGVKVREDADLAEILAALELDQEIPLEAFTAVAEILSYVYRANAAMRTGASFGGTP